MVGALFCAAGDFLPEAITTAVGTVLTNIKTDITSFITTNMDGLFALVGVFIGLSLVWFVVRWLRRAMKSG